MRFTYLTRVVRRTKRLIETPKVKISIELKVSTFKEIPARESFRVHLGYNNDKDNKSYYIDGKVRSLNNRGEERRRKGREEEERRRKGGEVERRRRGG